MVSELAQLLEPQRLNKSCKNTIFLLLYCESLNYWGVTELIKDYVKWEDSILQFKIYKSWKVSLKN